MGCSAGMGAGLVLFAHQVLAARPVDSVFPPYLQPAFFAVRVIGCAGWCSPGLLPAVFVRGWIKLSAVDGQEPRPSLACCHVARRVPVSEHLTAFPTHRIGEHSC